MYISIGGSVVFLLRFLCFPTLLRLVISQTYCELLERFPNSQGLE